MHLCASAVEALTGAELAVLSTAWPEYAALRVEDFVGAMTRARIVDPGWFLARTLGHDARLDYLAPGRAGRGTQQPQAGGTA